MKKLSKAQEAQRTTLVKNLKATEEVLKEAYDEINALITEKLAPAITAYNEVLSEVEEFYGEITGDMEEFSSERSAKWHDTETGEQYRAWMETWKEFDTSAIEEVSELDQIEVDHADLLDQLPGEPGLE